MTFRKGLLTATASFVIIALISLEQTQGFELFGKELPFGFKKSEYTRTRGEPIKHKETKLLQGKFLNQRR